MELLLVSNGPGELSGWALPLARALRRLVPDARLLLALPPCQYATGREPQVARQSGLFDGVSEPRDVVRWALGLGTVSARCVVHVGGDLWYAARLSRRARCPAVAYVERDLVARRHRAFAWVATHTESLARRLVELGVPAEKVEAVGDLRVDALSDGAREEATEGGLLLLLLPGSRPSIFRDLTPLMLEVADHVRARIPQLEVALLPSPFLPPELVRQVVDGQPVTVAWDPDRRREVLRRTALALALPGTSNVELGLLGVPMLVWLPLYDPSRVPLEGTVEWLSRLPVVGRAVKAAVVRRGVRRLRYVAAVNAVTGLRLVEEEVGTAPPEAVAARVAALLQDAGRLREMRERLRVHFQRPPGAAERLARKVLELAS